MAFDQLNALLAIVATLGAIICPFVLAWLNKKGAHEEMTSVEIGERLDKYEERLRLAEIAIARNERNHNGR